MAGWKEGEGGTPGRGLVGNLIHFIKRKLATSNSVKK
jgi:hypothetical protein